MAFYDVACQVFGKIVVVGSLLRTMLSSDASLGMWATDCGRRADSSTTFPGADLVSTCFGRAYCRYLQSADLAKRSIVKPSFDEVFVKFLYAPAIHIAKGNTCLYKRLG
jgi:hypothetical protein